MSRSLAFSCLTLLALGAACEAPPVAPTQDRRATVEASRIEGEVIALGAARGNAVLFLFDAARPPPPEGTGRPLSFSVVPAQALYGDALFSPGDSGPFAADYAFSQVLPGRYLIRGFIDSGCFGGDTLCKPPDFVPWYSVTSEPNSGDVGGAAVDAATLKPRVVEIGVSSSGALESKTSVPVSFADSAAFPVDRPSFSVTSGSEHLGTDGTPKVLELTPLPIDDGAVHQRQPVFLAQLVDKDGDGVPDDADHDGKPDLWPKVFVRKISAAETPMLDENDLDHNGVIDEEGFDYMHRDPVSGTVIPADGKPDRVVLAAGIDPTDFYASLLDAEGKPKQTPVPVAHLKVVIRSLAIDATNPAAPALLSRVPAGLYAITVMQLTGQTWRLPNELAPPIAAAVGLPPVESQSFVLQVP